MARPGVKGFACAEHMAHYRKKTKYSTKSRSRSKYGKWANMLLKYGGGAGGGAYGFRGSMGGHALSDGARLAMFGPSFKQRLLDPVKFSAEQTPQQVIARKAFGYRGDGDYSQTGLFNFGSGSMSGNKLSGLGDYGGNAGGNQIMAGSTQVPLTVNSGADLTGDIYFNHREFIGNVTAQTTFSQSLTNGSSVTVSQGSDFAVQPLAVNVGLSTTFPWLSQTASNFTMYRLMGCIFEYKPTSGEFGVTGSNNLGKVVMATQYDPEATAFTSSPQMENYDYATACKPSEHMLHGLETDPAAAYSNNLYVRTTGSVRNKIFTDYGLFQIATEGVPTQTTLTNNTGSTATITKTVTTIVGELWVAYKVKLSRARIFDSAGFNIPTDSFGNASNTTMTPNTLWPPLTVTAAAGNSGAWSTPSIVQGSTFPLTTGLTGTFEASTDLLIRCAKEVTTGTFLVVMYYNTQNIADLSCVMQLVPNSNQYCTVRDIKIGYQAISVGTQHAAGRVKDSTAQQMLSFIVSVVAPLNTQAQVVMRNTVAGSSNSYISLLITAINPLQLPTLSTV